MIRYRMSADAGDAEAMLNLGVMYENGRGVPKDEAEAVRWYRKSADAGDTKAMLNLGRAYENGQGVPKDAAEAILWFHKALSSSGLSPADHQLALDRLKILEDTAKGRSR